MCPQAGDTQLPSWRKNPWQVTHLNQTLVASLSPQPCPAEELHPSALIRPPYPTPTPAKLSPSLSGVPPQKLNTFLLLLPSHPQLCPSIRLSGWEVDRPPIPSPGGCPLADLGGEREDASGEGTPPYALTIGLSPGGMLELSPSSPPSLPSTHISECLLNVTHSPL